MTPIAVFKPVIQFKPGILTVSSSTDLMKQGIQIELCGATAAANHWINKDLLPGVKVNTNAMVRVTELEQKGFTLIYE
jgi:intracellular sulfur oxidation DsrE/DsrF family protein